MLYPYTLDQLFIILQNQEKIKQEKFDSSSLYSIKMILNESHAASASYKKNN